MREVAVASEPVGEDGTDGFGSSWGVVLTAAPFVDRCNLLGGETHGYGVGERAARGPALLFSFYSN